MEIVLQDIQLKKILSTFEDNDNLLFKPILERFLDFFEFFKHIETVNKNIMKIFANVSLSIANGLAEIIKHYDACINEIDNIKFNSFLAHTESHLFSHLFGEFTNEESNYQVKLKSLLENHLLKISPTKGPINLVFLIDSLRECCSFCKPTIYLIKRMFESTIDQHFQDKIRSFRLVFRYSTNLTKNSSKVPNNINNQKSSLIKMLDEDLKNVKSMLNSVTNTEIETKEYKYSNNKTHGILHYKIKQPLLLKSHLFVSGIGVKSDN